MRVISIGVTQNKCHNALRLEATAPKIVTASIRLTRGLGPVAFGHEVGTHRTIRYLLRSLQAVQPQLTTI